MIFSKAPLRVSFLGGGTDTKEFIENHTYGCVLGTTIDRFVYVFIDVQPSFEQSKYKFAYRKVEEVNLPRQFKHPIVREMLVDLKINEPLNIATMANLPGRSGLGSSSAFTVALYSALLRRVGIQKAPELIAEYAIRCERVLAQESGGFQDQYHSAVGGFRYYKFGQDGTEFSPHLIGEKVTDFMNQSMVLVATLGRRDSSVHAKALKKSLQRAELTTSALEMRDLCYDISSRIEQTNNPEKILALLIEGTNEGWLRKQRQISNIDAEVEQIIKIGMNKGAQAAKLCGAGGSGFVLFLCDPERAYNVRKAFAQTQVVVPKIVNYGASAYEI